MGGSEAISCSVRIARHAVPADTVFDEGVGTGLAFPDCRRNLMLMSDAAEQQSRPGPVFFDRSELNLILRVYGRMVAAAEWRDYAMVGHLDVAEFAVFRRSGDAPLYRIEKRPALRLKQGQWAVIGEGGHVLRRGRDLAQVLRVFDSRKFTIVD